MSLAFGLKSLIKKIESVKIPTVLGIGVAFLFFVIGFGLSFCRIPYVCTCFVFCALLIFAFTKKIKFFGAHTACIAAVIAYLLSERIMFSFFPLPDENKWYGDCLITDGGVSCVQSFFSLLFSFLSYYVVKLLISIFFAENCENPWKSFKNKFSFESVEGKGSFEKVVSVLNRVHLPHDFGMRLLVICFLGHVFFGFTNAHLYNACEEYNYFNNVNNPVCDIPLWHVMDVLLFYVSVLVAVLSFKVKYKGAMFVRISALSVFLVLCFLLGYPLNLCSARLAILFLGTVFAYVVTRFLVLKCLVKK